MPHAAAILVALSMISGSAAQPPRERRVGIDYTISLDRIPTLADLVEIWIPVPREDARQSISQFDVTSDVPYAIVAGEQGNRVVHIKFGGTLIRPSMTLSMRFAAKRRAHPDGDGKSEKDAVLRYWLESPGAPIDEQTRSRALEATEGAVSDVDRARAIYKHVAAASTFTEYARALGIPARFASGLVIPKERGQGVARDEHCWAEFYVKGLGWLPADAAEEDENRVEFWLSRQPGARRCVVFPYAEIDGKPFRGMKTVIRYADLGRH